MDVNPLNPQQWQDIFGTQPTDNQSTTTQEETGKFGMAPQEFDLFNNKPKPAEAQAETKVEGTEEEEKVEKKEEEGTKDVDILGLDEKNKPGRKPKYDFSDAKGYFEDRIKNGKFVPVTDGDGEEAKTFIPGTPEEFDEFLDIQVNYKLEQERKQLEDTLLNSKSPAWRATLKYAELIDDPTELLPFLAGVQNIQQVASINPDEEAGAEQIIRMNLQQKGVDPDVIDTQVDALKSAEKLVTTAQKIHPQMLQQEQVHLQQMEQQRRQQMAEYQQMVSTIREDAIKAIETPIFGNKLTREEKAAIYDLIAEPSPELQGYAIYSQIDKLFETKDFDTLKQIALFVSNKDAFLKYVGAAEAQKVSSGLQRKLRVAADSHTTSKDSVPPSGPTASRTQFTPQNKGLFRMEPKK